MIVIEMLDDERFVTEVDDVEFTTEICEDCEQEMPCYIWTSTTSIRYAFCAPHLAAKSFARLAAL